MFKKYNYDNPLNALKQYSCYEYNMNMSVFTRFIKVWEG